MKISNDRSSFITLWLEPWGEDYGMSPGDEFEVAAAEADSNFHFQVSLDEKGVKVWAEGDARTVSVYKAGEILACGHNRREEMW